MQMRPELWPPRLAVQAMRPELWLARPVAQAGDD
jgi:hypothetical protein